MNPLSPSTSELQLFDTIKRGVPNEERVAIKVNQRVDCRHFGIMVGVRLASGNAIPLHDNFFWLGNGFVEVGDWILVYTRVGQPRTDVIPNTTNKLYSVFWGKPSVIFSDPDVVPILFKADGVQIGHPPASQPSLPQP